MKKFEYYLTILLRSINCQGCSVCSFTEGEPNPPAFYNISHILRKENRIAATICVWYIAVPFVKTVSVGDMPCVPERSLYIHVHT